MQKLKLGILSSFFLTSQFIQTVDLNDVKGWVKRKFDRGNVEKKIVAVSNEYNDNLATVEIRSKVRVEIEKGDVNQIVFLGTSEDVSKWVARQCKDTIYIEQLTSLSERSKFDAWKTCKNNIKVSGDLEGVVCKLTVKSDGLWINAQDPSRVILDDTLPDSKVYLLGANSRKNSMKKFDTFTKSMGKKIGEEFKKRISR